jgi:hypothetical protein
LSETFVVAEEFAVELFGASDPPFSTAPGLLWAQLALSRARESSSLPAS